jgi:hypothetical protein
MTTKADRVLVWLALLTLVFGGLGATVAVFLSDVVMARRHPLPRVEAVKASSTTNSTFEGGQAFNGQGHGRKKPPMEPRR